MARPTALTGRPHMHAATVYSVTALIKLPAMQHVASVEIFLFVIHALVMRASWGLAPANAFTAPFGWHDDCY